VTDQHPDSPRPAGRDDEVDAVTREQQQDLGYPNLEQELGQEQRDELADETRPGQNSDWMPQ